MGVRCEVLNGTVLRGFEQEERTFSLASDSKEGWTTLVRVPLSFFFFSPVLAQTHNPDSETGLAEIGQQMP